MIDLSRRGLIKGILASTVLIGLDAPSLAAVPDRYRELIETQRKAIMLNREWAAFQQRPDWQKLVSPPTSDKFRHQPAARLAMDMGLMTAMNNVIVVLNTRFNQEPVDIDAARWEINRLLEGEITVDTLSESELRQYEDYIVSVAVARDMLQAYGMPLNGQHCEAWHHFVARLKSVLT